MNIYDFCASRMEEFDGKCLPSFILEMGIFVRCSGICTRRRWQTTPSKKFPTTAMDNDLQMISHMRASDRDSESHLWPRTAALAPVPC
jgi:hypothetical protein